ncbi:UNVERIFIED_CONTAM: hypothetical protein Sradi_3807700, partial [Sesamum radiatum]
INSTIFWRRWKHEIKVKYFLPHIDDPEYLSRSPTKRVEQDQWKELVIYWSDEDVKMMMKGTDPSTLDIWLESRWDRGR